VLDDNQVEHDCILIKEILDDENENNDKEISISREKMTIK
jgi:hypothetical protein